MHKSTAFKVFAAILILKIVHLAGLYGLGAVLVWDDRPDLVEYGDNPGLRWDSGWYQEIVEHGYSFTPGEPSSVAFWPAFPLAGRVLYGLIGIPSGTSLLLVAHLAGIIGLWAAYLAFREYDAKSAFAAMLLLGLFPGNISLSIAYGESLFLLFFSLTILFALRRQHMAAALCAGILTACKPMGIVGPLVFFLGVLADRGLDRRGRLLRLTAGAPLSVLGIVLFMAFLRHRFGSPWIFISGEAAWNAGGSVGIYEALLLISLVKETVRIWLFSDPPNNVRMGVLLFLCFLALSYHELYRSRRWLVIVGLVFLFIPYLATRGDDYRSFLRYIGMSVPHFAILAHITYDRPLLLYPLVLVFGLVSMILCAEFANWYWVF